jgi:integrase
LLTELPRVHHLLAGGGDHGGGHGVGEEAIIGGTEDPWGDDPPLRDVSVIEARLVGAVVPDLDDGLAFGLSFPPDRRAERAANAYLGDLAGTFARPLTLRSYGYDILRWLRFLAAVEVSFDAVVRGDYLDFRRWLVARGKTGGARRPRAEPAAAGRVNPVTGKRAPHEREFGPATIRHSRVVLFDWYEFLYERGGRPLVNPIPARRRRDGDRRRGEAHHSPLEPSVRGNGRRVDPPDPRDTPRHLDDDQFEALWSLLGCDRDRAMAKSTVDSGIRPGELIGLRGEDIDWGNALVHVVRKGGRREQWLPVSGDAIVWLRRYQAEARYVAGAGEPLWVTRRGRRRPFGYDAWRAVFARINARLGSDWTPHDLRHTACMRMLDAGMDVHRVQEIMGHEHLETTERYIRPRLDELIEAQRGRKMRPAPPPAASPYDPADLEALFGAGR